MVEDDADGEFLIGHALKRRFPGAAVRACRDADDAVSVARSRSDWLGFVVHRALDLDGIGIVRRLRAINERAIVVMVSGRDQRAAALAAGASHFIRYNDWSGLGALFDSSDETSSAPP